MKINFNFTRICQAFDKKTTVMTYLVRLLQRQHPETLLFKADLMSITDASQISWVSIIDELTSLDCRVVGATKISKKSGVMSSTAILKSEDTDFSGLSYSDFLCKASRFIASTRVEMNRVSEKFKSVLAYFGEDPNLETEVFFQSLHQFSLIFEQAVQEVKRQTSRATLDTLEKLNNKPTCSACYSFYDTTGD